MRPPLEGIRVVELASFVAAPAAGALLRDLGAEVIKVEVPEGEVFRNALPRYAGLASDFPEAPGFQMDNRGKRSLALDVSRPAGQRAIRAVIDRADVLLTNMLPARLQKYGLHPEALRRASPRLIVASLSGYGRSGPEAEKAAFDYTAYWSRTGMMDLMHEPEAPPAYQRPGIGDHAASLSLVTAILAALRQRDQSGEGQELEVSLLHIGYYVQGNDMAHALVTGETPPRHDRREPRNPLWNQYPVRGGRWLFLVNIDSGRYWPRVCKALELGQVADDPRFADPVARYKNGRALVEILDARFAERTLEEWGERLDAEGVIWAPVRTMAEATRDPQARASGVFQTTRHPTAGEFETVAPPMRFSGWDVRSDRGAPALGADASAILREAGLSPDQIREALEEPAAERP